MKVFTILKPYKYMQLLLILLSTCLAIELDKFVDKEIRVFVSGANHIFLGMDTKSYKLTARSKFYDLRNFATVAKIIPDSAYFRIRFYSKPICVEDDEIIKCDTGTSWTINSKTFGYTIGDGSKCITLADRSTIRMMPCTETEDQIFDFKLKNEDEDCGENQQDSETKSHDIHREILMINIPNNGIPMQTERVIQPIKITSNGVTPNNNIPSSNKEVRMIPIATEKVKALPIEEKKVSTLPVLVTKAEVHRTKVVQPRVVRVNKMQPIKTNSNDITVGSDNDTNANFLNYASKQLSK
ncbi:hypothetical protein PAEPH01_0222 [Pancytospora epiphaga]|nr:hypothetical protein PAEPH01_0222 [Pancytospora epiphaga]